MPPLHAALFIFGIPIALGFIVGVGAATAYGTYKLLTDNKSNPKETKSYSVNSYPAYLR